MLVKILTECIYELSEIQYIQFRLILHNFTFNLIIVYSSTVMIK